MSRRAREIVFVADDQHVWLEAEVIAVREGEFEVTVTDLSIGEQIISHPRRKISSDQLLLQETSLDPRGISNLCHLNYMHEPNILDNLRRRFLSSLPYTSANDICIAVNPYKSLLIYSQEVKSKYATKDLEELEPHIYALSRASYDGMCAAGKSQSLLVSGESGAGKTESMKLLLDHIAFTSAVRSSLPQKSQLFEKILRSNPLLESFGNAKTSRNDNSSRFGKYVELLFDHGMELQRSNCTTYLLEKSRVVHAPMGESNFYIFHELLAAPEEVRQSLHLSGKSSADFIYTQSYTRPSASSISAGDVESYANRFTATRQALREVLGLSASSEHALLAILAGILHLGQLRLQHLQECSSETNDADCTANISLSAAASLLQVDEDALHTALTSRVVSKERIVTVLSTEQAQLARDALVKETYSRLFNWLVRHVNLCTRSSEDSDSNGSNPFAGKSDDETFHSIALLDIFGFENFETNCFEQLCINYCNEKLQHMFTADVILDVQKEYRAEGIDWVPVPFDEGGDVLRLFEGRGGLIALLNEECIVPAGSDSSFLSKLRASQKKSTHFKCSPLAPSCFTVSHYADKVAYSVNGFLEKNKDSVLFSAAALLATSSNQVLAALFAADESAADSRTVPITVPVAIPVNIGAMKKPPTTTLSKFRAQLETLLATISATEVRYVRCIKPNSVKNSEVFDRKLVVQQLRSGGVVEVVRVSRAAYPHKMSHSECLQRFWCWHKQAITLFVDPVAARDACLQLMHCPEFKQVGIGSSEVTIAATKVYFREGVLRKLDALKLLWVERRVRQAQRNARTWVQRLIFRRMCRAAVIVQTKVRCLQAAQWFTRRRRSVCVIQASWRTFVLKKRCSERAALLRRSPPPSAVPSFPPAEYPPELKASSYAKNLVRLTSDTVQCMCPHCGSDVRIRAVTSPRPPKSRTSIVTAAIRTTDSGNQRFRSRVLTLHQLVDEVVRETRAAAAKEWETLFDISIDIENVVYAAVATVCFLLIRAVCT